MIRLTMIGGEVVTVRGVQVSADDDALAEALQGYAKREPPSPSEGQPEAALAERIARKYGGTITYASAMEVNENEEVY